jgi:hypothetical protein
MTADSEAMFTQFDADVDAQLSSDEFALLYGENRALFDVDVAAPMEPTPAAGEVAGDRRFVVRASDLVDLAVLNENGEAIATLEEALVNRDGTIQYLILNTTPLEELDTSPVAFAIAMSDLEARADDAGTEIFDEIEGMALFYVGATPLEQQASFDMNLLEGNGYVINDSDQNDDLAFPEEYLGLIQLQDYADYEVVGVNDESVANIEDALVDLGAGTVPYLVGDVGGFLGIAEQTVLIPWAALTLDDTVSSDVEDEVFRSQLDEETLADAPTFDLDAWELPNIETWDEEFAKFWQDRIGDDVDDMDANANSNTNANSNDNTP